jgi:glycosyltransferase involved in cell wall biosynthesis
VTGDLLERSDAHVNQVVVISHDVVGAHMAGPGIRYSQLAEVLAREFDVALAVPVGSTLDSSPVFGVLHYSSGSDQALERAVTQARVVVVPAIHFASVPVLADTEACVVVDGSDPFLPEALFLQGSDLLGLQRQLAKAYQAGDFFICASERQRDWWLGTLEAYGRINRLTLADDRSFRNLVDLVPFGLPSRPPEASPVSVALPGVEPDDEVLLWGGGLWDWLDPMTAVRAVEIVLAERPRAKLLFPGTRHPNQGVPEMRAEAETKELATGLGLGDDRVAFGDWVPHPVWSEYLKRARVGLSLHPDTIEARLAYRTRILDYIWAGLPMVVTGGDETSRLVREYQIGEVVDYGDHEAVATAVLRLLEADKEDFSDGFARARTDMTWERAARPLVEFCRRPRKAADKRDGIGAVGSPYYLEEIDRLRRTIRGYENGRVMRAMRKVQSVLNRARGLQ